MADEWRNLPSVTDADSHHRSVVGSEGDKIRIVHEFHARAAQAARAFFGEASIGNGTVSKREKEDLPQSHRERRGLISFFSAPSVTLWPTFTTYPFRRLTHRASNRTLFGIGEPTGWRKI